MTYVVATRGSFDCAERTAQVDEAVRAPVDDAPREQAIKAPPSAREVALRPAWVWLLFAVFALAVPLIGFWLERAR